MSPCVKLVNLSVLLFKFVCNMGPQECSQPSPRTHTVGSNLPPQTENESRGVRTCKRSQTNVFIRNLRCRHEVALQLVYSMGWCAGAPARIEPWCLKNSGQIICAIHQPMGHHNWNFVRMDWNLFFLIGMKD